MAIVFKKAQRRKAKARVAIDGPAGAGKSLTALRLAMALARGGRVCAIDTEHGSLSLYAGDVYDGRPLEFEVIELKDYAPNRFTEVIVAAEKQGYDVIVIDSLSHAWIGKGGALDIVDNSTGKNKFTAWKDVTPLHRGMIDAIIASRCHVIATMRSKTEYVLETNPATGKAEPRKIGVAPQQRDGMEFEFTLYGSMDTGNVFRVTKSRCDAVNGLVAHKPTAATFQPFIDWLDNGAEAEPAAEPVTPPTALAPPLSPALEKIKALRAALGINKEQWEAILEKRGVTTARDLTAQQLAVLTGSLEQRLAQRNQPAPEPEPVAATDDGKSEGEDDDEIPF